MKKAVFFFCALVLCLLPCLTGCSASARPDTADPVVAAYNGSQIKQSVVDYEKQNMALLAGGEAVSDEQALKQLLRNLIMLDEAERLGISVTQEEVDDAFTTQLKNYQQYEDAQAIVDDFCADAGITTEAYFSMVEEQLPRVILRQKLRDALGQEYCDQHGLSFTKVNPPQEMQEYVENYLNSLLETYSADITYYAAAD